MKSFLSYISEVLQQRRENISSLVQTDQNTRKEYADLIKKHNGDWQKARDEWISSGKGNKDDVFGDEARRPEITKALKNPKSLLSKSASKEDKENAFILAQHADTTPKIQKAFRSALARKGMKGSDHFKYITDRILCNKGKPQKYGTQDIC